MIFVDASAAVAITAREAGWEALLRRIVLADVVLTSPLCVWEATAALARTKQRPFEDAVDLMDVFLGINHIETIPITPEIGTIAVEASRRFGRGRHKAELNFGDCFAYACARSRDVPLLYNGEDFVHTDIEAA